MAPLAACVLLAAVAAGSQDDPACSSGSRDQHVSLLQAESVLTRSAHAGSAQEPDCSCLNWKQAYQRDATRCGLSNEFYFATSQHAPSSSAMLATLKGMMGGEFCDRFYQTLDDNFCVNVNMGDDRGQWCYVSAACAEGTAVPGAALSWKQCGAQDTQLRDFTPTRLSAFAADNNLDLGLLHKMSYPLYQGHLWGDVEAFWGLGGKSASSMLPAVRQEIQAIVDSGKPYSFDTAEDNHPPHRIVVGRTVYAVSSSPTASMDHPGSWNALTCVSGCDQ